MDLQRVIKASKFFSKSSSLKQITSDPEDLYSHLLASDGKLPLSIESKKASQCTNQDYISLLSMALSAGCEAFSLFGDNRKAYKKRNKTVTPLHLNSLEHFSFPLAVHQSKLTYDTLHKLIVSFSQ